MMRRDVPGISEEATLAEFRRRFPLGSVRIVVATDATGAYAGLVRTSLAYAADHPDEATVASVAQCRDTMVQPDQDVSAIMRLFEEREVDDLAVVAPNRHVLGLVGEKYVRRRYTEEIEKAQRELFGD
jgi:CIC family chloride channel protein